MIVSRSAAAGPNEQAPVRSGVQWIAGVRYMKADVSFVFAYPHRNPLRGRTSLSPIRRQLQTAGYADLGITDPTESTRQVAETIAVELGAIVATSIEQLKVTPLGVKPLNTYGGNYGFGELPLHSDLAHWHRPPRYLLLRCVTGSPHVSTRLFDRCDLEKVIPAELMRRALFSPRRRLEGKTYLLRMLTRDVLRWDSLFLSPKNESARKVAKLMSELGSRAPVQDVVLSERGRTVLLDNWRVLHGRSTVPANDAGRSLDRAYLDLIENGD